MSTEEPTNNVRTPESRQDSDVKRSVSERKLRANRNNALRSTGPKTAQGKQHSSRNAVKHGILAREVLITAGEGKENSEDFATLLQGLQEHYKPSGIVEEMLVETMATSWWRQARTLRAENGQIRMQLDTAGRDRAQLNSDEGNLALLLMSKEPEPCAAIKDFERNPKTSQESCELLRYDLRQHQSGLEYLRGILLNAKSQIASGGYILEKTRNRISSAFSSTDYWFAVACDHFRPPDHKGKEPVSEEIEDLSSLNAADKTMDEERAEVIAWIDSRLQRVGLLEESVAAREKLQIDAGARSFSLPSAEVSDKLLRYDSHLDRQLYRAMDQLERLQRQRRGEIVPPPLSVNLGRRA
jgi:hypothetical protein